MKSLLLCVLLLALCVSSLVVAAPSSFALKTASFVPPASPTITTSSPAPTLVNQARQRAVVKGYGTFQTPVAAALYAKKKKKAPAASKKIQVKMTKHVAGTGSAGDVVLVTPAFYNNKLRPTQSAIPISDEQVEKEQSEKQAQIEATNAAATKLKEQLEADDFVLVIQKSAGPEGQLFGGVGAKLILKELQTNTGDDYLNQKQVKVTGVTQDGKKIRGDIKHTGDDYQVTLSLTKEISAKFNVSVQGES